MEHVQPPRAYLGWRGYWVPALALAALLTLTPAQAAPPRAPVFDLELFDGTTFRLADARGSAVVLLFWAPW
ncbi:MAG TPA: hypothetical protein VFJ45_06600 [bacterium]|nr:hypothetical protein [bacterium]